MSKYLLTNQNNRIFEVKEVKKINGKYSELEKDIEDDFCGHIKTIGWKQGENFTRNSDVKKRYKFRNDSKGTINGEPDYIFYDDNSNIIAICDVKSSKKSISKGLQDTKDYIVCLNQDYSLDVRFAITYNGISFAAEYFNGDFWEAVLINNLVLDRMPYPEFLQYIIESKNEMYEYKETYIEKDSLKNFFARCDEVIRQSNIGSSPTEKFVELSSIIFLKMFTTKGLDKKYINNMNPPVWDLVLAGKTERINGDFLNWLNKEYENLYIIDDKNLLIRINPDKLLEISKLVEKLFNSHLITDFTNVKGDILEFFQSGTNDRKIGEFFTPRHIIELMVTLTNPKVYKKSDGKLYAEKIYDPTCGTGGFLIEAFNRYKSGSSGLVDLDIIRKNALYGTELKGNTALLAKLNMILIGDGHTNIVNANALGYKKKEVLQLKKDVFGNPIPVDSNNVTFDFESGEKIYFIKNNRHQRVSLEKKGKKEFLFDEFGEKIEITLNEVIHKEKKRITSDGFPVKKDKDKYYKQHYVKHLEYLNNLEEDKVKYSYSDINSVNPELVEVTINGECNPKYQKDFENFDIVLANQPFGVSEPPKADYLFIEHMLKSLKDESKVINGRYGKIACIVGNGFLFDSSFVEERKTLQENYTIKSIIQLPSKSFAPYVKTLKSNIILIEKRKPSKNHKTLFVKLEHDGFTQDDKRFPEPEKNQTSKFLKMWKRWEEETVIDPNNGKEITRSSHEEEKGFAEYHEIEVENWSVNNYVINELPTFTEKTEKLGKFITESVVKIHPIETVNDSDDYVEIKGVSKDEYFLVESDLKKANKYRQEFKVVTLGELAYNPSRINIGSIGMNNDNENVLVSPSYTVFNIKTDTLLPKFVLFYLKSEIGKQQIENYNFGTVRNSLDIEDLKKIEIPMLSLSDQEKIVRTIEEAEEHKRKYLEKETEAKKSFNSFIIKEKLYF